MTGEEWAPYIVIWIVCGLVASFIATDKGLSGGSYFLVGVLLGPIGILIAALSSRSPDAEARRLDAVAALRGVSDDVDTTPRELERLASLHVRGELSDEEFAAAKRRVLRLG